MSSNIKIQRVCQHCGNEFTAKTTVTKYCGDVCAKRAYKARQKTKKILGSNEETRKTKTKPIEELKAKEFLNVQDVASLLGCSLRTVYRIIDNGTLRAVNLAERMTRVKRSELDKIMEQPLPNQQPEKYKISECYSFAEIKGLYGVSEKALHGIIKRNEIHKINKGKFVYVPKITIDKLFN